MLFDESHALLIL